MAKRRKQGDGTVRLRKDGRWEGRYVIGYDDKGLPKTKNVLAKTKTECVEKLKKLKESFGEKPTSTLRSDMPFGSWLDFWYLNYSKPKLRPKTQTDYENNIYQHIIPELGQIPLDKLTSNDLQQFYAWLKKGGRLNRTEVYGEGLSDRMVRACHTRCRTALEKAIQDGLIRTNPAVNCKLPPQSTKEMQVLNREEMQRFLIQAKEEGYYELFLLELATGLRRGELLALQWDDLNFDTGELRIERQVYRVKGKLVVSAPKTKASLRTIVLPPSLVNVLREYRERVNSCWMFPSPKKEDSPLDPAAVRKRLHTILEHAQCKTVRFHDLRHTFATTALEKGMDVKTLSAIIGHVSAATTLNTYTHVTDAMQRTAAAKIDQGLGKAGPPKPAEELKKAASASNMTDFKPYQGKYRKPGTGCVSQINDHLWEGRYSPTWPDGEKHARNVYAHSLEECEEKLAELIRQMKAEIAQAKELAAQGKVDEAMSMANGKNLAG